ncbi:MAG TPA: PAS domain-containing protein [Gammaproteobacteria bacterium]|nr:PAS domain-containing protein [Gammaproteobacteria bacterium]
MSNLDNLDPELLQRLLDASNDGIVVAEQEGDDNILIYVNDAFERLTGYSRDEILFRDCRFLQGEDRDQFGVHRIRDALRRRQPCREVIRNYRRDGTMFWNELSITPVFDERDQLTYYIGIQKDVTARIEAEREAERLRNEMTELRSKTVS